jgi:hypothetical protein
MRRSLSTLRNRWLITAGSALAATALPRFAAASFLPPSPGNLEVWLNAGTGVTAGGGGAVSAWADQSGNGHNATQSIAADQPVLVASSSSFNGQPALSFNGSTDYMQAPLPLSSAGGLTVFVVANHKSANTDRATVGGSQGDYGGSDQWFLMQSTASSNLAEIHRDSITTTSVTNGPLGTSAHVYTMSYDGSAQTLTQTVDGSTSSSPALFANMSLTTLDIGSLIHFGSGFNFGDVNIAEILVYNSALSPADDATVQSYLTNKYTAIPEPGSLSLLVVAGGLALRRRRSTI